MTKFSIVLSFASVGLGQTAKPTPKPLPPSAPTWVWASDISAYQGDPHCGYLGTWDEGKKVCAITVMFSGANDSLTCSPISSDGVEQRMICWYKPAEPKEKR